MSRAMSPVTLTSEPKITSISCRLPNRSRMNPALEEYVIARMVSKPTNRSVPRSRSCFRNFAKVTSSSRKAAIGAALASNREPLSLSRPSAPVVRDIENHLLNQSWPLAGLFASLQIELPIIAILLNCHRPRQGSHIRMSTVVRRQNFTLPTDGSLLAVLGEQLRQHCAFDQLDRRRGGTGRLPATCTL
jgi:hypothetical protein